MYPLKKYPHYCAVSYTQLCILLFFYMNYFKFIEAALENISFKIS
ncbi:hypothetical protein XNC1_1981 [Xenorhabdus nematophila ATCC 19061]|uniref:Uncharacterized protein n=1 Tax=Xenorhabdus nematophila (strain ATCC 19061 / DSM 3370 / CCUG 14189 / LMG 1036 / NCIMB 9965 / AN6) TaxID=406817 RepID=D3VDX4_XENNA|nr:hypothetical protein XNC1_1981 [Xenorhabdus nematophila ATCC 19061]